MIGAHKNDSELFLFIFFLPEIHRCRWMCCHRQNDRCSRDRALNSNNNWPNHRRCSQYFVRPTSTLKSRAPLPLSDVAIVVNLCTTKIDRSRDDRWFYCDWWFVVVSSIAMWSMTMAPMLLMCRQLDLLHRHQSQRYYCLVPNWW